VEEVLALVASNPDNIAQDIDDLLKRYRVQTKPRTEIPEGMTARDALAARLVAMWRQGVLSDVTPLGALIDTFRMQHKKSGASAQRSARKKVRPRENILAEPLGSSAGAAAEAAPAAPTLIKSEGSKEEDERSRGPISSPVAGGPQVKKKTRSECPKCHSQGVVLARSYAGDDYFSCIYCGWQGYKPIEKPDFSVPVATQLLGQEGSGNK
jgi:hypothetical protein